MYHSFHQSVKNEQMLEAVIISVDQLIRSLSPSNLLLNCLTVFPVHWRVQRARRARLGQFVVAYSLPSVDFEVG